MNKQESIRKKIKGMIPSNLLIQRLDHRASNCVLLTFDDGPHPEVTPEVLKRLEKYEARAIFFIPGRRIEKAPYLLKIIQEQGHLIGNHTYIHSNGNQPWFFEYWRDLIRCQEIIEQHTKQKPILFRPAGGGVSFKTLLVPWFMGLKTVTWSLEVEDWRCRDINQAQQRGTNLVERLSSGDIILLHDDNPFVLTILDILLPTLQSKKSDISSGIKYLQK